MKRKPLTWITFVPDPIDCMICKRQEATEIIKSGNETVTVRLLVCTRCADIIELIT
jgi:hypothetical protein